MKTTKLEFISIYFFLLVVISAQSEWSYISLQCPGGIPNCLYMDRRTEYVYAGCYGGVWKLNQPTNEWTLVDGGVQDSSILPNAKITAMHLNNTGVFYVGCDSNIPSYISYNGGRTWRQIQDISFTLLTVNCITEHPDGSVYFGTNRNILKTLDHGKTWIVLENSPTNANDFVIDTNGNIFVAVMGGVYKSNDNGTTWAKKSNGMLSIMMTAIEIDSKGVIWVGADGDVHRSDDSGQSWISTRRIQFGGHIFDLTVDKNDIVYIACELTLNRSYLNYTDDSGSTWNAFPLAYKINHYAQLLINANNELFCRPYNQDIVKWFFEPTNIFSNHLLPNKYELLQNYPNPFNPSTTIKFSIPSVETRHASSLHVLLKVYDLPGREIATLVNEEKLPGNYEVTFNAETRRGESLPSGVYFYTLSTNGFFQSKKMLLMK